MSELSPSSQPTSADVARHAGVSRATVSYVVNDRSGHSISEQTRQRVLRAVRELGYAPHGSARTLRSGRSNTVLMPMPKHPFSPAVDSLIENLDRELATRGLCLLLHGDREAAGIDGARAWAELRPAAVYLDTHRCTPDTVELLRRAGVEVVLLNGPHARPYAPTVLLDQAQAADRAARYLIERGHRRLACLVPRGDLATLGQQRADAVAAVAEDSGVPLDRIECDLTIDSLTPTVAAWREPGRRPDAVYAYNDEFALMLIQALRETGLRVPDDIAVIGSGDLPLGAMLRPRLTSTYFAMSEIGTAVAASIRRLLDGQDLDPELPRALLPHLVARESA